MRWDVDIIACSRDSEFALKVSRTDLQSFAILNMQVYLVGGAVRDELLGLPVHERDWVVVGAQPDELIAQGFKAVGKDFPVFLHPENGEEYALARTERKTAPGYTGFETRFSPDVSLEQDLLRRDLTINAIAKDPGNGQLIDPFDGRGDLEQRLLRHVSPAFVEDPVRVLRVARFAARFDALGFKVADETLQLMREIAARGELNALVPERVWQETERALQESAPWRFFEVLQDANALAVIFPEIAALFGVPQPARSHPEIDTGIHTLMVLRQAARLSSNAEVRFAALTHDLGKAQTPRDKWPTYHGHEQRSVKLIESLCGRLRIPNAYRELAIHVARFHGVCHRALELRASTVLELFEHTDAFRRPQRFEQFLLACEADIRGRLGLEERAYPQADHLRKARAAAAQVSLPPEVLTQLTGTQIGERIRQARIQAIAQAAPQE